MTRRLYIKVALIEVTDKWLLCKRCPLMVESSPSHSFSSKSRNSEVFAHFTFKIALSFAVKGIIPAYRMKFIKDVRAY